MFVCINITSSISRRPQAIVLILSAHHAILFACAIEFHRTTTLEEIYDYLATSCNNVLIRRVAPAISKSCPALLLPVFFLFRHFHDRSFWIQNFRPAISSASYLCSYILFCRFGRRGAGVGTIESQNSNAFQGGYDPKHD